jgi:hypothetical protein
VSYASHLTAASREARDQEAMFKWALISVVLMPVLIGVLSARNRPRTGLVVLLAVVFLYDLFYVVLMYYLRVRWVG